MSGPLVAVADSPFPSLDPAKEALSRVNAELKMAVEPTPDGILAVARDADAVLVTYAKITGEMIGEMKNCKSIGRFGIGVDNIDIATATEAGIVVTYVPDYCFDEVSDHAMALLLDLARKVSFSNSLVQSGRWEMPAVAPLYRLRGRTLGLVGLGNIPQMVVPKAQAFGLKVVAYDPYVAKETAAGLGVELMELDALLAASDYVSVHAPLTPETKHLIGADAFRKMKPTALLVNTARGPLVDTDALAVALDNGEIGGAALDVVPVEPLPADSPLLNRDNLVLTPHTAFYSVDALLDLQSKAAQDVARVLAGERPVYPVNPDVLK
jgi:D-3-phosphoglycerate dehydrogenase